MHNDFKATENWLSGKPLVTTKGKNFADQIDVIHFLYFG